jgi:hypothetical protein
MAGARQGRLVRQRRRARVLGALGFAAAVALPVVFFRRVVVLLAAQPDWHELHYLTGWLPWVLIGGGLLFLLPVAWSAGRDPESRFFPRARAAYAGWGITLYLLGVALGSQVAQLQSTHSID